MQIVLIALNAVFASAEIAVLSLNETKLGRMAEQGNGRAKRLVRLTKEPARFLATIQVAITLSGFLGSAFAETKLGRMAEQGNGRAKRLVRLTKEPARFLATIQVAITLSGFLGSAFAADNFSEPLVDWMINMGVSIPRATLDAGAVIFITLVLSYFTLIFGELVPKRIAMKKPEQIAMGISGLVSGISIVFKPIFITLVLSYFTLIFGELVPKRIAMKKPEQIAMGISGLVSGISIVFKPIVSFLSVSTNLVLRLCGIDPKEEEEQVSEEEIRMMVDVGSEKGTIEHQEKEFIQNVFEFNDIMAESIATHRTDVVMLWMEDDMEVWAETIHNSRHTFYPVCDGSPDNVIGVSRHTFYPVCDGSPDNVIGVLNAKDYFRIDDKSRNKVMNQAVYPAYFVLETTKADVLFRNMKANKSAIAIIIDEHGGMTGIVTMNDLVEELVGDLLETTKADVLFRNMKANKSAIAIIIDEHGGMTGIVTMNDLVEELVGDLNDDTEDAKLFRNMKANKSAIAIIIDEHGGMTGIVTMNDLVEELVGDLNDDTEDAKSREPYVEKAEEHTWLVHGNPELEVIEDALGIEIASEGFDTLSGLIFQKLGVIPEDGTQNIELEMQGMQKCRECRFILPVLESTR